jgi:hypothetical protein
LTQKLRIESVKASRGIQHNVFSPALEVVLTVAYREASSRRHTHLTLEHLLYALAHDPDGERILAACGADLPQLRKDLDKYLKESVEQFGRGQQKEPEQTLAFRRVLQTAVLHVQSAGRQEVQSGDVLAATLQQNKSYAAQLLAAQGVTRLDVLEYITHGISKVPPAGPPSEEDTPGDAEAGFGEAGTATSRDPLSAYAASLTARARAGELDPLIGRRDDELVRFRFYLPPGLQQLLTTYPPAERAARTLLTTGQAEPEGSPPAESQRSAAFFQSAPVDGTFSTADLARARLADQPVSPAAQEKNPTLVVPGRLQTKPQDGRPDRQGKPTAWAHLLGHIEGREGATLLSTSFHGRTREIALALDKGDQITAQGYIHWRRADAPSPSPS